MYYSNRDRCYLLQYQLVINTKNSIPLFSGNDISNELTIFTYKYFKNNKSKVVNCRIERNYICITFETQPNVNLSNIIKGYKTNSTILLKDKFFHEMYKYNLKQVWDNSFFICSLGDKNNKLIKKYLHN